MSVPSGEVYKAHDEHLDRDVAIKVLPKGTLADEKARRRFRKEALALSKLSHPNIATVHDFGRGRPPIPKSQRMSEIVHFKVSKRELSALRRKAGEAGLSISELLRKAVRKLLDGK